MGTTLAMLAGWEGQYTVSSLSITEVYELMYVKQGGKMLSSKCYEMLLMLITWQHNNAVGCFAPLLLAVT